MKHSVFLFSRNIFLHFHRHLPGQHRQQQAFLNGKHFSRINKFIRWLQYINTLILHISWKEVKRKKKQQQKKTTKSYNRRKIEILFVNCKHPSYIITKNDGHGKATNNRLLTLNKIKLNVLPPPPPSFHTNSLLLCRFSSSLTRIFYVFL